MFDALFSKKQNHELLKLFQCGIERETLRVDEKGSLSKNKHPYSLGSPLTHPYIHTDFGEAQLEWNTPPFKTFVSAEKFLEDLMSFSAKQLKTEYFWPFSMPCPLENVQIAQYANSPQGRKKEIYRKGLQSRYGLNLQMISSLHFNFSFPDAFWKLLHTTAQSHLPLQEFINAKYLHLIRNFLREGWLLSYLFGASPAMDKTYPNSLPEEFHTIDPYTFFGEWSTSIRMSHLGYYSRIQNQLAISFNDLKSYIKEMKSAISTPKQEYANIPSQLNDHVLQIENEHYSRIRPKTLIHPEETPLQAMTKRGIEYVEIRSIDLNPYYPLGMNHEYLCFLHQFLLYCLFKPSPTLSRVAQRCLACDQNKVALEGRKPGLKLSNGRTLQSSARNILKKMDLLTSSLGYEKTLKKQQAKIENPELTPSAEILKDLKKEGMRKMGLRLAKKHHQTFLSKKISLKQTSLFTKDIHQSHLEQQRLETSAQVLVEGYESLELSTQIMIREAQKRGIRIEVLDEKDNILMLSKGKAVEYIKQATKTSKDTYITPHILENKQVTKKLLQREGFQVPLGKSYTTLGSAIEDYPLYQHKKIVVKPKSTNYGVGITFVRKGEKALYHTALEYAFSYGDSVLVEDFFPGKEYRFLVVNGKVIAISYREPAHVIGDGMHSIKQLVHIKNTDPKFYRSPKTQLQLGKKEKCTLKEQKLEISTIPKEGEKVYLRHNSNVSTGGDAIDFTEKIHPDYKKIAVAATQAMGMKICGVDIMLTSYKEVPHPNNHVLIELNYNPVLFIHAFPNQGKNRNVAGPILDLLFEE